MTKKNEKKWNQQLWKHQCHGRRKGEGAPGSMTEIPLQPLGEECGEAGCLPEVHVGPHAEAGGHVRRKVQHVEKACRSRFSVGNCNSEFMLEQSVPEALCPMERSLNGTVHGGL